MEQSTSPSRGEMCSQSVSNTSPILGSDSCIFFAVESLLWSNFYVIRHDLTSLSALPTSYEVH